MILVCFYTAHYTGSHYSLRSCLIFKKKLPYCYFFLLRSHYIHIFTFVFEINMIFKPFQFRFRIHFHIFQKLHSLLKMICLCGYWSSYFAWYCIIDYPIYSSFMNVYLQHKYLCPASWGFAWAKCLSSSSENIVLDDIVVQRWWKSFFFFLI